MTTEQQRVELVLKILNKVKRILSSRGKTFIYSDHCKSFDISPTGLCDLLDGTYRNLCSDWYSTPLSDILPEFNREYCCTIAPSTNNAVFWWSVNSEYGTNYDVESRLKVINHFIDLYTSKLTNK